MTVAQARDYYTLHGVEAIPLWPNTKKAIGEDWQHRPLADL